MNKRFLIEDILGGSLREYLEICQQRGLSDQKAADELFVAAGERVSRDFVRYWRGKFDLHIHKSRLVDMIEVSFKTSIRQLLRQFYTQQRLSPFQIKQIFALKGVIVNVDTILIWLHRYGISVEENRKATIDFLNPMKARTQAMTVFESILGLEGVVVALYNIGLSDQDIADFFGQLAALTGLELSIWGTTVADWRERFGCASRTVSESGKQPRRRKKISRAQRNYYDNHPEAREYRSLLKKEQWQKSRHKFYCPAIEEFIQPDDCNSIQQSFEGECWDKNCLEFLKDRT